MKLDQLEAQGVVLPKVSESNEYDCISVKY